MSRQAETGIVRQVMRQLRESVQVSSAFASEEEIFRSIYEQTTIFRALVEAWTAVCADSLMDADELRDFYGDEMLGYSLCQGFNSAYYTLWQNGLDSADEILSDAEQNLNDEVFDLLVRYIELQVNFNGLGDITKRTYEAITAVCLYDERYRGRLDMLSTNEKAFDWRATVISMWEELQGKGSH